MKKMNYITTVLVIISLMVLSFDRLWGEEAGTNSWQLQQVNNQVTPAEPISYNQLSLYNKSWAVVIGVNNYEKWPGLEYAVNDATSVKKRMEKLGFDEIITLMDNEATKHNITQILGDKLPHEVQREDRLLIFFAGHGLTEEIGGRQYGYIIPVDGEKQNYYSSAISMAQVREFSKRIQAKHIYYVIDACYSGLGLARSGSRFTPSMKGYLKKVTSLPAIQMLTAGGKGEQVMESDGHGLFTEYFLSGIEGHADTNTDGVVTASELGAYLRPSVSKASGQKQTPNYGSLEGEGDFVFVLNKGTQITTARSEPPELRKRERKLREREKELRAYAELLKRQEKEQIKKQIEMQNILKRQKEETREKERRARILQGEKKVIDRYAEDEKRADFESLEPPPDIPEITRLRSRPGTLSKSEMMEMIKSRGFRDSEWNPGGDFPNIYKGLTIKGDKVVVDYATGLMWQQSGSSTELRYSDAKNYIHRLNRESFAGFSDWRLPTVEELASLLEPKKKGVRYIDPVFNMRQLRFWSADKRSSGTPWSVSIRAGIVTLELKDSKYYVRGVRLR